MKRCRGAIPSAISVGKKKRLPWKEPKSCVANEIIFLPFIYRLEIALTSPFWMGQVESDEQ
jgi:hypothetical protein